MYKVVVVEDEEIARKGIIFTINWDALNCMIAGEAANGEEGAEVIRRLSPDIIVTDLKKPRLDGVEMDAQQTSDIMLVTHHDFVIDWHTDMRGQIYDMTEGELKALDFGSWKDVNYRNERIATLQEALALCRSMEGCAVQLEMKSTMDNDPAFVSGVVDAIRAADIADRLVLISFNHDLLRQAKQLMPELKVGVLVYGAVETMALPTSTWEMLGLQNGLEEDDFPQLPPLSVENVDDENCSWALRWMGNQISMLQANFPGKSLVEVAQRLLEQRDPVK